MHPSPGLIRASTDIGGPAYRIGWPDRGLGYQGADADADAVAVAVGIVIVDGPTPGLRFTAAERTKVIAEVQAGLSDLVGVSPSANVSFLYDIRTPSISVPVDPNLPEDDREAHWRVPALEAMGFASTGASVDRIRQNLGSRWTYAASFVKYPVRHFAYQTGDRVIMQ